MQKILENIFRRKNICFNSCPVFYLFLSIFCFIPNLQAAESLSYSGRLVNANGSPVSGPVDLKIELSYTNAPTTILCSQDFTSVALSNGVFHLKLDLNCGGSSLSDILIAVPASEAASLRVKDVTNNKTYSFQAIHSMPFANISETAKQLVQMGASNGQILRWNDTTKKWEPGIPGGGGTVTNVTASAPLSVTNGGITPALSITQANTTTAGYLSSADWNIFNGKQGAIVAGTTAQYYRGDKSWQTLDTSAVAENIANLYFTNARVLGVPLTGFSVGAGAILNTDTVIEAFGKSQGQINAINTAAANFLIKNGTDSVTGVVNVGTIGLLQLGYAPIGLNDAANKAYVDTKLDLTGGTLSGDLSLNTQLKLKNGGAANYVTLKAPAAGTTAYTLSLPLTAGSPAQVLTTDGAGITSWTTPSSTATPSGSAGGDLTGTYPNPTIAAGKIVDAQVSATAAIAQSKIANLTTDLAAKELAANVQGDVRATTLTGYAVGSNTVLAATDTVLSAFQNVQGQLNAKEGAITAAATTTYYRGDKTFVTLDTAVVPENGNLYFTNARALGVPLTGFSATNSAIVATDTVLTGFNKTQGQINNLITGKASLAGDIFTGDVSFNTKIKLRDAGTNYVQIQAPAAVTSTYTITLPATAGSAAQVLTTDGTGVMSWSTPSATATPSGSAGGDLTGTYPNPTIAAGKIVDATVSATAAIAQSKIANLTTDLAAKQSTTLASGNILVGNVGNVATAVAMSGDATMLNTGALTLKNTGTAGTYSSVTTDSQGRVTAGSNPVVVNSITGTAPVTVAGTASVPVISMAAAATAVNGYLTSADWNIFNAKQAALSAGATINGIVYPANGTQTMQIPLAPLNATDAVNKQYVDSFGQWTAIGGNIYRPTGNVGIGTTVPSKKLDISDSDISTQAWVRNLDSSAARYPGVVAQNYMGAANSGFPAFNFLNSRGTGASATAIQSGDMLGAIVAGGNFDTNSTYSNAALIEFMATGNYSSTSTPSAITFKTAPALSVVAAERMRIDSAGNVGIGTAAPGSALDVKGTLRLSGSTSGYVGFAPAAVAGSITYTLPTADGSAGQILKTNGAGILSWVTDNSGAGAFSGTINKAVGTDGAGALTTATTSMTELNYVAGVTSSIQTQLNAKQSTTLASANFLVGNVGNVATAVTMSGDATMINTGAVTLKNTGTAGTYTSVTTDAQGRVTAGTNPVVVTSITGTAPVTVAGTSAVPVISMAAATTAVNGYLTSTDWNTFNGKQAALSTGPTINGIVYPANAAQTMQIPLAPVALTDAVNKQYVDSFGQWTTSAGNVYRTSGNVGINTTAPGTALDVNGVLTQSGMISKVSSYAVPTATNLTINLPTSGTNLVDGYVYKFTLATQGTATVTGASYLVYQTGVGTWASKLVSSNGSTSNNPSLQISGTNVQVFHNHAATYSIGVIAEAMQTGNITVISPNFFGLEGAMTNLAGNIGIGTNAPATKLDVNAPNASGITVRNSSESTDTLQLFNAGGGAIDRRAVVQGWRDTVGAIPLTLQESGGNVGIGTTTPGSSLDVKGTLRLSGATSGYVGFAPATAAGTTTYLLPVTQGSAGQILSTDGVATTPTLSWITPVTTSTSLVGDIGGTIGANTIGTGKVTSTHILDGTIVDADISATAAIAQSKISGLTTSLSGKEPTITAGAATQYIKGDKTLGTFATDVQAVLLSAYAVGTNTALAVTDSIAAAFGKIQGQLNSKEGSITAGTTAQFYRGDKSWQTLNGLAVANTAAGNIAATTVQAAINELDTDKINKAGDSLTTGTFTLSGTAVLRTPDPVGVTDVANKQYVDGFGQWTKTGSDIYRNGGNVGIGTIAPTNLFHIHKTGTGTPGLTLSSDSGSRMIMAANQAAGNSNPLTQLGDANFIFHAGALDTGALVIAPWSASARGIRMDSGGNVGIGTASPLGGLHVKASPLWSANNYGPSIIVDGNRNNALALLDSTSANPWAIANAAGVLSFSSMPALGDTTTAASIKMTINSAGQVGIGSSLDVTGNIATGARISSSVDGANNAFWLARGSSAETNRIGFGINADPVTGVVNSTTMRTNGVNRVSVDINGNVGIGIGVPLAKLHIQQVADTVAGALEISNIGAAGNTSIFVDSSSRTHIGGTTASPNALVIDNASGNTGISTLAPSEKLEVTGNVKATAYLYTSDKRLKKNIVTIEDSLQKILRLRGVEFDWKKNDQHEIGLIAQEVEDVLPNLVATSSVDGMKSVKYGNIVAVLVEAMKEEHQQIVENKKLLTMMSTGLEKVDQRVRKLEREIASLKDENKQLKDDIASIKKHLKLK